MPSLAQIETALDDWWKTHIMNSVVSRETAIHNYLSEKFQLLKSELVGKPQAAEKPPATLSTGTGTGTAVGYSTDPKEDTL